jgi:small subunit ribosomal protein S20
MPVTKTVKKSLRKSEKNRAKNLTRNRTMKGLIKEAFDLSKEGKNKEVKAILPKVYKAIDKAAKQNIIKKNNASRKKSSVARLANPKSQ